MSDKGLKNSVPSAAPIIRPAAWPANAPAFDVRFMRDMTDAVIQNDIKSFRALLSDLPKLSFKLAGKNGLYTLSDDKGETDITFDAVLGFYGRADLLDEFSRYYNNGKKKDIALNALWGALQNPDITPRMVRHIVRTYKVNMSFFMQDDLCHLIGRGDYDTLAFVLGRGASVDRDGFSRCDPVMFQAIESRNIRAMEILCAAGSLWGDNIEDLRKTAANYEPHVGAYIEKYKSRVDFAKRLHNHFGSMDIDLDDYETVADMRRARVKIEIEGQTYLMRPMVLAATARRFDKVLLKALQTGETVTRMDLYGRDEHGLSVMDMVRFTSFHRSLFCDRLWQESRDKMPDLYKRLNLYDRYKAEDYYLSAHEKYLSAEIRLEEIRAKMPPKLLKRRWP